MHAIILGKNDTWREVSKTTFACNPQLLKSKGAFFFFRKKLPTYARQVL